MTSKPCKEPQAPAEASVDASANASPRTPGQALRRRPWRLVRTSWPWRSLVYLLLTPVTLVYLLLGTLLTLVYLLLLATPLAPIPVYLRVAPLFFVAGAVVCWPVVALAAVPLGRLERARLGWVDLDGVENPHRSLPGASLRERIRARARERSTWTEVLHVTLLFPLGLVNLTVLFFVLFYPLMIIVLPVILLGALLSGGNPNEFVPPGSFQASVSFQVGLFAVGLLLLVFGLYAVTLLTEGERHIARYLLGPDERERLGRELAGVASSRARMAAAFDEARATIERDLHDGAQQRLTSLLMTLATAKYRSTKGGDVADLIDRAIDEAQHAIDEMRDLVHGIYPAALRERDLAGALRDAAERCGMPATAELDVGGPLPRDVEAGLYFAVSELLTNATKHSKASALTLTARRTDGTLAITISDDGVGGATTERGTGLLGVADRIETLGGTLAVESPPGGPTEILMEIPCGS